MLFLALVLFFCLVTGGRAQTDTADVPDTIEARVAGEQASRDFVMTKSPTLALVYGIVPGGGQFYTEQYWKIPLFAVPIGVLAGIGIHNHNLYRDRVDALTGLHPDSNRAEYAIARNQRDLYEDRRDLSFAIGGVIYLLSLIDAYVGAHLYDFDVSDTLSSIYIYPDVERNGIGLGVRW